MTKIDDELQKQMESRYTQYLKDMVEVDPGLAEGYRTRKNQEVEFKNRYGRRNPAGYSNHSHGGAVDVAPVKDSNLISFFQMQMDTAMTRIAELEALCKDLQEQISEIAEDM